MPKIVDKKEKAKSISDAALKVFRELGYPHTRMVDIAKAAGIGKGTVYEYFKNKADILRFAFEQYFNTFNEDALQTMMKKINPADRMIALVDFALRHVDEWEDHCAVYVDYFGVARTGEREWFSLAGINDQMKHLLKDLIKEGQATGEMDTHSNPEVVAELLLALFDGIIFHRIFVGQDSDQDLMHNSAIRFITRGLLEDQNKHNRKDND
jgi:TetR/AcrR family fatty acid metabolism transcriptional regulator